MHTSPLLTSIRRFFANTSLLLVVAMLGGCVKGPNDINPPVSFTTEITTLYGRITDEAGIALTGVNVTTGTQSGTTDENGIFIIKNATVPKGRAVIIAKKTGYFNGAKAEPPGKNGITKMELSLMTNTPTATITGSAGGTVNMIGGAKIQFTGGSFVTTSGSVYAATVNIAARYLSTSLSNFFDYFSGDNEARSTNGSNISLISNGVIRVSITGTNGEELRLKSPATLTYPKSNDDKAPSTMPLWYFDEALGMWKEEGRAELKGNVYTGEVLHFSDWNLDYQGESGTVSLRVLCNEIPVEGVVITIVGDDGVGGKYFVHPGGITGPDGTIRFRLFPANRQVLIDIQGDRNNGLFFINAPISVNLTSSQTLDIGDISLNSPCPAALQGLLVGCNDGPTEGLVAVHYDSALSYVYTKNNFLIKVPVGSIINVSAIDNAGNMAVPIDVASLTDGEQRNIGLVKICGTNTVSDTALSVSCIALSPDGTKCVKQDINQTSKYEWTFNSYLIEIATGKTLMYISSHKNHIAFFKFSGDGNLLFKKHEDGYTDVFDISGTSAIRLAYLPFIIYGYSKDGKLAVGGTGYSEKTVSIVSTLTGSVIKTLTPGSSNVVCFRQNENSIVVRDPSIKYKYFVWSIDSDKEIRSFSTVPIDNYFSVSEDGEHMAVSADYRSWTVYGTLTGKKELDYRPTGVSNSSEVDIALTNNYLFTNEQIPQGRQIKFTNLSDGSVAGVRYFFGDNGPAPIYVSKDEKTLIVKSKVWKLK